MEPVEVEQLKRGKALRAIRQSEGFAVLEELIERKRRDLFERWMARTKENGQPLPRSWCDGYNTALSELVSSVDEMIARASSLDPAEPTPLVGNTLLGRGEPAS